MLPGKLTSFLCINFCINPRSNFGGSHNNSFGKTTGERKFNLEMKMRRDWETGTNGTCSLCLPIGTLETRW